MNVLSLFAGIGGLDLGLERAGMTVVGQVEIDPWCRRVLAKHWPEVPRHDDVRTCADWWLGPMADAESDRRGTGRQGRPLGDGEPRQGIASARLAEAGSATRGRPAVDLVCGGFPCQPVSFAGKRLAQADERWLWPAMADTIRRLRPRFALMENVPGLLVRGMGDVLGDLAACGYDAEWDCVPASAVGAPHRRDRVWIVGYANGGGAGQDARGSGAAAPVRAGDGTQRRRIGGPDITGSSPDVAYPAQRGCDSPGQIGYPQPGADPSAERSGEQPRILAHADREPLGWPPVPRDQCDQWAVEPGVGRVAHGIPRRVDRLRGLGNAVVPQVAEHIGRMIMEAAS